MNEKTDQDLLIQLQTGDKVAFDCLYEKYWEIVFDTAFILSKDKDFAMDATQDIFLSVWERKEIVSIKNIHAYLRTAAKNKFLNWIKSKNRNISISDLIINTNACETTSDYPLLLKELLLAYERVVSDFPASQQKIYRMRYEEGLTTKEIASQLDVSQKTVQNQLGRSLLTLKKSFPTLFHVLLFFLK